MPQIKNKNQVSTRTKKASLEDKVDNLTHVIDNLEEKRFYKLAGQPLNLLGWGFLKGLVTGMGAIIGATALVALMVFLVGRFSILPEWLQTVLDIVNNSRSIK